MGLCGGVSVRGDGQNYLQVMNGPQVAGDLAHDPLAFGGGQGRGTEADRRDGRAAGALGQGSMPARGPREAQRARARSEGEAEGGRRARGVGGCCQKVAGQIKQRVAGEPIKDRIVSLHDPDARPIRKGKLGKPTLCRWRDYPEAPLAVVVIVLRARGFRGFGWSGLSAWSKAFEEGEEAAGRL
jgi:hypothetical protein